MTLTDSKNKILSPAVFVIAGVGGFLMAAVLSGCYRGSPSENPPIQVNQNMAQQQKYKPQSESRFFADRSAMRTPVSGAVARGQLKSDRAYFEGVDSTGAQLKNSPVPLTMEQLNRGKERFDIYCSVCHSRAGDGQGIMIQRGYVPPPTFHSERLRQVSDGYIFDVISNGIRNMPAYRYQVPVADRWAIVAYMRALQRSQNAAAKDIPPEMLEKMR